MQMIKICDAIMGSGKSSSAITYINEHPEKKYLYIAPYLTEATRIKEACQDSKFVEPSDNIKEYGFSKARHTMALVERGRNVTTTHQAVRYYTPETLELLKKQNYTILIDEEINVFQQTQSISDGDVIALEKAGLLTVDEYGCLSRTDDTYTGTAFSELFDLMDTRHIVRIDGSAGYPASWYSIYPKEFLEAANEVIVMTYMFRGSEMEIFLKINHLDYTFIGIEYKDGVYRFTEDLDDDAYVPDYVGNIKNMIHILDDKKMNSIGDAPTALSKSWYKNTDSFVTLRSNLNNFFRHKTSSTSSDRICGMYADERAWDKIKDNGFAKSNLSFNCRATNEYREKDTIAYIVNLYCNVGIKLYYKKHGYDLDDERYALSTMVQFLWRSAIRDGKEIWLYLPSKRMRTLLLDWMENLTKGGAAANETTEVRQVSVFPDAM